MAFCAAWGSVSKPGVQPRCLQAAPLRLAIQDMTRHLPSPFFSAALCGVSMVAALCSACVPSSAPGAAALLSLGSLLLARGPLVQSH